VKSLVLEKSKRFAVRIVKLYTRLRDEKHEYVMSKQLLRCGTSIGANLSEAEFAISENDFLAKLYIALKETAETLYWLELLHETGYMTDAEFSSIGQEADEIQRMLSAATKTIKERQ
jgi:TIGR02436 family protein